MKKVMQMRKTTNKEICKSGAVKKLTELQEANIRGNIIQMVKLIRA